MTSTTAENAQTNTTDVDQLAESMAGCSTTQNNFSTGRRQYVPQWHPNYRHARKPGYRKHGGVWDGDLHWEPDAVHPLRRRHPRTFNLFSDAIKYKPITLQHERPPSLPSTRHTFVAVRGPDEPLPRTPDTLYTFSHSHTLLVFRLAAPSSTLCRRLRMPG